MPIQLDVWRIDEGRPKKVTFDSLADEAQLEDVLDNKIEMLGLDLLVVGRQVPTAFGKVIDLLGVDAEGDLHIIELKRDKTPRDVVGQVLDYASWVRELGYDDVVDIFSTRSDTAFEAAFDEHFGTNPPDGINENHHMVIVASGVDPSTERIVGYLADEYGVSINAILFSHFTDDGHKYLARTWLVDPTSAAAAKSKGRKEAREPWNGQDFYISFGQDHRRNWEDAVEYGFVSGGGGKWYTQSLGQLFPGARVFVNIPKTGYVGVGRVTAEAVPVRDFQVRLDDGGRVPILEAPTKAPDMDEDADDDELCEWLVGVTWIKTLSPEAAVWEKGMFANQNTAAKLRNSFTIERLVDRFGLEE